MASSLPTGCQVAAAAGGNCTLPSAHGLLAAEMLIGIAPGLILDKEVYGDKGPVGVKRS